MFLHLIPKPRAALGKRGLSPTHPQGHSGPVPCILSSNTPLLVQGQTSHSPYHCQVTLSLRMPESFWPGLQSLCGHCCGGCVTSGTGCLAQAPGPPCRAGQRAAGCVTSASTAGPGRARPLRWAPCHLHHQMLLGPNIALPVVPNLVINRGASARDGAGAPARWRARLGGPRGGAQGRPRHTGPAFIQCTASPCLVCGTLYFLNFFLFRAFHSPSCVARLLKSCFTFRFLSASLKEKKPVFTLVFALFPT